MTEHRTPIITDRVSHLREDLFNAGYTVDGVRELLGDTAHDALHREQTVAARRAVRGKSGACAVLVRMFLLGEVISEEDADLAFPTVTATGAVAMQLLEYSTDAEGGYRAVVDLRPHQFSDETGLVTWWFASDMGETVTQSALHADHVLGAGGASLTLAQVTPRRTVSTVLDIGTGSGIQALHASRHASTIVATDISQRALDYAAFNAALNDIAVDLRHGSLFEPVAGEKFDVIVSNPPFVITPRAAGSVDTYEYRDGGQTGDRLVGQMISGAAEHLAPGGTAVMLGNWEISEDTAWDTHPRAWVEQTTAQHGELDTWFIQREQLDPAHYAETWLRDGGMAPERNHDAYTTAYEAWLDDFDSRGVSGIGFGIIVLHRPLTSGATMNRYEEITGDITQPLGPTLAATLEAVELLRELPDDAFVDLALTVAEDVTEERYYTPGSPEPHIILLRQGGGLRRTVQADTALAGLVGASDGELTIRQILTAIAALYDLDSGEVFHATLPALRGLVIDGLLNNAS
ncbi:DUF7059 domain-containing protein [Jonesia quinghaiensis]|uniref:DUF7059 domain-containing protein n=1 Tax=Jonesia quinghaiensis TaxID=262806 RepID=UPI0003FA117D|nr:methyltransferase [Jonesia quinghaiensis]